MTTHSIPSGDAANIAIRSMEYYAEKYQRQNLGLLSENGCIKKAEEVGAGQAGDTITVNTFGVLGGTGVGENQAVEGNERDLSRGTFSMSWNETWQGIRVPSKTNIQQMRLQQNLSEVGMTMIMDWHMDRMNYAIMNQAAGNNATSIVITDGGFTTTYSGANRGFIWGHNTPTDPTSARISRPNSRTTDETLVAGDEFTLDLLDEMIADITGGGIPFCPISDDIYAIGFLHPKQIKDLKKDTSGSIQWLTVETSLASGGDMDNLKVGTNGGRRAIAQYENVLLYSDPRVPYGVNSTTDAAVTSARRAVFFGKDAIYGASPLGLSLSDDNIPIVIAEETFDYKRFDGVAGGSFCGFKKFVGEGGQDNNVAVIATYVA